MLFINMKKCIIITLFLAILCSGCSTFQRKTNDKAVVSALKTTIETQNKALSTIGTLSYAVAETDNIQTAHSLNKRIGMLSNTPSLPDAALLKTNVAALDLSVGNITKEKESNYNNAVLIAEALNTENAKLSSQNAELTNITDSALGSIWNGVSIIIKRSIWTISIVGILFLIVRIFASSNPIAAGILSVFSKIGATIINFVSGIIPDIIKHTKEYKITEDTNYKIINALEYLYETYGENSPIKLSDVFDRFSRDMDSANKELVKNILSKRK